MGAIKINGSTSGSTTITAPATGSDETVELFTALAAKAPLASPTFTGTVALPSTTTLDGSTLNLPGLVLVTSGTFTSTSKLSVNDCFTSAYTNYRICIKSTCGAAPTLRIRLRASATDNNSANYHFARLIGRATPNGSGTLTSAANEWDVGYQGSSYASYTVIDITSPQSSDYTTYVGHSFGWDGSESNSWTSGGTMTVTTSYDGFSFFPSSSTISGNYRVYGLRD